MRDFTFYFLLSHTLGPWYKIVRQLTDGPNLNDAILTTGHCCAGSWFSRQRHCGLLYPFVYFRVFKNTRLLCVPQRTKEWSSEPSKTCALWLSKCGLLLSNVIIDAVITSWWSAIKKRASSKLDHFDNCYNTPAEDTSDPSCLPFLLDGLLCNSVWP